MNKIIRLISIGLALSSLLSACGSGDDAQQGASLSYVRAQLPKEPRRLFPLLAASSYESQVNDLIYQYLLHFDPVSEELAPQLAEEMPAIQTFRTGKHSGYTGYTFRLRENARWSDGKPVTVDDVLFTFKAVWFPGFASSPLRGSIRELVDLERDSADARSFTLVASTANFNGAAYYGNIPILPEHIYDSEQQLRLVSLPQLIGSSDLAALPQELQEFASEDRTAPFGKTLVIGSGPYQLDAWEPGQYIRLVRTADFWGAELDGGLFLARPDTIEFVPVPDATAALAMLVNGDLDVLPNVVPREAMTLRDNEPDIDVYTPLQFTRTFIYLNSKDPLLSDRDTRRGLAHLLDVEGFLRDVQLGFGKPLEGPYHPSQSYAKLGNHPVAFQLDSAIHYLERAGWRDLDGDGVRERGEQRLAIEYLYPASSKGSEALALLYAADAAKAGVDVTPIGKEFGALFGDLGQRNFQMVQGALGSEPLPDDPYDLWHTSSDNPQGKNRSGFGDAASDALIDSLRVNLDPASRRKQSARLARHIAREQPVIFLIVPQERIAVRSGLKPVIMSRRPGYYLPGFRESSL